MRTTRSNGPSTSGHGYGRNGDRLALDSVEHRENATHSADSAVGQSLIQAASLTGADLRHPSPQLTRGPWDQGHAFLTSELRSRSGIRAGRDGDVDHALAPRPRDETERFQ